MKPIGFIPTPEGESQKYINKAKISGLPFSVRPHFDGWVMIGVANRGTLGEHFDLNQFLDSYRIMSKALSFECQLLTPEEERRFANLWKLDLSYFLLPDYDHIHPQYIFDFALNGLILGYPIESTVAVIMYQVYY